MSLAMQEMREAAKIPANMDPDDGYFSREECFKHFLPEAEILFMDSVGSYQGTEYALFKFRGNLYLWRDSYGSCSGCDGLCGERVEGAFEYFKATLCEGNTRYVASIEDAVKYLRETEDYHWHRDEVLGLADKIQAALIK